jgi:hypothetical protein
MRGASMRVIEIRSSLDAGQEATGGWTIGPAGSKWRLKLSQHPAGRQDSIKVVRASIETIVVAGLRGFPCFEGQVVVSASALALTDMPQTQDHRPQQVDADALFQFNYSGTGLPLSRTDVPGVFSVKSGVLEVTCFVLFHGASFNKPLSLRVPRLELPSKKLCFEGAREKLGVVGIVNQGATCYLSSLLQSLFHTRLFRAVVYHTPVDAKVSRGTVNSGCEHAVSSSEVSGATAQMSDANATEPSQLMLEVGKKSKVVHALQRVFAAMEGCSKTSVVSTKPLTDSFGG